MVGSISVDPWVLLAFLALLAYWGYITGCHIQRNLEIKLRELREQYVRKQELEYRTTNHPYDQDWDFNA